MREREYLVRVTPHQSAAVAAAAAAATERQPAPCQAGLGFASVIWHGERFEFGGRLQRAAVAALWAADEAGTPDVPEAMLLQEIESNSVELRQLFKGHAAWGTLIVRSSLYGGPIGCYRLRPKD
jgi:hypothetical protein